MQQHPKPAGHKTAGAAIDSDELGSPSDAHGVVEVIGLGSIPRHRGGTREASDCRRNVARLRAVAAVVVRDFEPGRKGPLPDADDGRSSRFVRAPPEPGRCMTAKHQERGTGRVRSSRTGGTSRVFPASVPAR